MVNIFRTGFTEDPRGDRINEYQANLIYPGKVFAKRYSEDMLSEFLRTKVGVSQEELVRIFDALHQRGRAVLGDVDIPEAEISGHGMQQTQDEY